MSNTRGGNHETYLEKVFGQYDELTPKELLRREYLKEKKIRENEWKLEKIKRNDDKNLIRRHKQLQDNILQLQNSSWEKFKEKQLSSPIRISRKSPKSRRISLLEEQAEMSTIEQISKALKHNNSSLDSRKYNNNNNNYSSTHPRTIIQYNDNDNNNNNNNNNSSFQPPLTIRAEQTNPSLREKAQIDNGDGFFLTNVGIDGEVRYTSLEQKLNLNENSNFLTDKEETSNQLPNISLPQLKKFHRKHMSCNSMFKVGPYKKNPILGKDFNDYYHRKRDIKLIVETVVSMNKSPKVINNEKYQEYENKRIISEERKVSQKHISKYHYSVPNEENENNTTFLSKSNKNSSALNILKLQKPNSLSLDSPDGKKNYNPMNKSKNNSPMMSIIKNGYKSVKNHGWKGKYQDLEDFEKELVRALEKKTELKSLNLVDKNLKVLNKIYKTDYRFIYDLKMAKANKNCDLETYQNNLTKLLRPKIEQEKLQLLNQKFKNLRNLSTSLDHKRAGQISFKRKHSMGEVVQPLVGSSNLQIKRKFKSDWEITWNKIKTVIPEYLSDKIKTVI